MLDSLNKKAEIFDICELLKIDRPTARKLVNSGILPKSGRMFDPLSCIHAYIDYLKAKTPRAAPTIAMVAEEAGVDLRSIKSYMSNNGYSSGPDGLYDVDEAIRIRDRLAENKIAKTKDTGGGGGSLRDHEIRYKKARADREELKAGNEKGALVDRSIVIREQISRELAFKKAFMGLPRFLATRLLGCGSKEIEAVVVKYVSEAFRKLSRGH